MSITSRGRLVSRLLFAVSLTSAGNTPQADFQDYVYVLKDTYSGAFLNSPSPRASSSLKCAMAPLVDNPLIASATLHNPC
jgi:hypothetical protein